MNTIDNKNKRLASLQDGFSFEEFLHMNKFYTDCCLVLLEKGYETSHVCKEAAYMFEKAYGITHEEMKKAVHELFFHTKASLPPVSRLFGEKSEQAFSSNSQPEINNPILNEGLELMKTDEVWRDHVSLRYNLTYEEMDRRIDEFAEHCKCIDKRHYNVADVKQHFCQWLNIIMRRGL